MFFYSYYDEVGFTSGMQVWFQHSEIKLQINEAYHVDKIRGIFSYSLIAVEKAFDKNQHHFIRMFI